MKTYFKYLLLAALAFGTVACDKHISGGNPDPGPVTPPTTVYEEVLSVNFQKVWSQDPGFPGEDYIGINIVFPDEYFNTFTQTGRDEVGRIRVENYGKQDLMFGTGIGHDYESTFVRYNYFKVGDGVGNTIDSHYYSEYFNCKVGTYELRLKFQSNNSDYWCTPKFRVEIDKDKEGEWIITLTVLEE